MLTTYKVCYVLTETGFMPVDIRMNGLHTKYIECCVLESIGYITYLRGSTQFEFRMEHRIITLIFFVIFLNLSGKTQPYYDLFLLNTLQFSVHSFNQRMRYYN